MKISERVREAWESLTGLERHNPWEKVLIVGWQILIVTGILLGLVATLGLLVLYGIALFAYRTWKKRGSPTASD